MLAKWTKLLPVVVYAWIARRKCSRIKMGSWLYCEADKEILVLDMESWRAWKIEQLKEFYRKHGAVATIERHPGRKMFELAWEAIRQVDRERSLPKVVPGPESTSGSVGLADNTIGVTVIGRDDDRSL